MTQQEQVVQLMKHLHYYAQNTCFGIQAAASD